MSATSTGSPPRPAEDSDVGPGPDRIEVRDPWTGRPVGSVDVQRGPAVDRAVGRAHAAAEGWARTAPADRAACVRRLADLVEAAAEELAHLQTAQMGKPFAASRGGVAAGVAALRQYAELGPLHRGRALQGSTDAIDLMAHVPRGVAAVITPWNDPVAIVCQLVGANLVVGNTVVLKPSERTPLDGLRFAALAAEVLPSGVLEAVTGDGATGAELASDPRVDVVAMVGSAPVGRSVALECAARGAHAVLELGGNDALVVDADVDPAWAAEQAAIGAFTGSGQICTSVERIYVHERIADRFVDALVGEAHRWRVGDPNDARTRLGPLVDERHVDHVHEHVSAAVRDRAHVEVGGHPIPGPGCGYPATVLVHVGDDMLVMREETFGPVAPVRVVDSFEEALCRAGDSTYGLAATILTADADRARAAWRDLPAGTVKVNDVFGGAPGGAATPLRRSGHGFGYGPELLDELAATRVLHVGPAR